MRANQPTEYRVRVCRQPQLQQHPDNLLLREECYHHHQILIQDQPSETGFE